MSSRVVFPTAWDDQGTRKTSFGAIFISLAERLGYTLGHSLKVPGSYCFEFHQSTGSPRKIGLKSAYDRALNTAFVMGEKVDEVWVFTFKWNDNEGDDVAWRPTALQVYSVDTLTLSAAFNNLDDVRRRSTTPKAYGFIPIDHDADKNDPKFFGMPSSSIDKLGKLIFEAPLHFSDRGSPRIEDVPAVGTPVPVTGAAEPSQGLAELVFAHKEALAKLYATTPDRIKILIEA